MRNKWLFFHKENKEIPSFDELIRKHYKQYTFCYCRKCNNELISSNSFVEDNDGIVTYKCSKCGTISEFDFCIAPAPILVNSFDDKLCKFCADVKFTHKKFKVLTQRGEIVETVFNYCPTCGKDLRGIKGQKWGVRRFQNADGSLTDEGKKRYECPKNDSE